MPLSAGSRLGAYEILSSIGAGGMGEVYRARDTKLQRDVAIKVLPMLFAADRDRLARFEREAQVLAVLNHPHIAQIYGVVEDPAALVMEYVDGEDLAQRLARGRLPVDEAIGIARQIAEALEVAHDRGIVHRDLKPANVKVSADGKVKVLDFGLALDAGRTFGSADLADSPTFTSPAMLTNAGVILGTAAYMAPEQARGKTVDRRADIWAFGCVLYEMLTGAKPFGGDTVTDVLSAIVSGQPDWTRLPRPIPRAVVALLKRCLDKDAHHRLRDIGEARVLLEQPLDRDTPEVAGPPRTVPLLVFGGCVALIAGAAYWAGAVFHRAAPAPRVSYRPLTFGSEIVSRARFTPDGTTVVYSAESALDPPRVFMTRLDGIGSARLSLPDAMLLAISPSTELALATGVIESRGSLAPIGTLARAPLLGGAPRAVSGNVSFADWSPRDGQLAIVAIAARERLEFPIGHTLYETGGAIGLPRFSRDGRYIAFIDWPVKDDDRGTVAVIDLDGKRIVTSRAYEGLRALAWSPDGREVWYSASRSGEEYSLEAWSLDGHERRVAEAPTSLIIEDVSAEGKALVYQYDRSIRVGLGSRGVEGERDLSWLGHSWVRDFSPDGRQIALSYSGAGAGENYTVFVRGADGSDAVRIGDGQAQQFSPDGRWVLSVLHGPPSRVMLLPTGAGEPRAISTARVVVTDARWLADGKRLVVVGAEPGHGRRAWLADLAGGLTPMSPENITFDEANMLAVAGDGRVVLRTDDGAVHVYGADGRSTAVVGLAPDEMPIAWTDDDRALLVTSASNTAPVDRLDLASGKRERWLTLRPPDAALLRRRPSIVFSRDGKTYAANYQQIRTRLFLAEGLR